MAGSQTFVQPGLQSMLTVLACGPYHAPRVSAFGGAPDADEELLAAFLKDRGFLLFSPSAYNAAGLGTTQRCNATWVYQRARGMDGTKLNRCRPIHPI